MAVDDSYTKSLLHFDGNITDESGKTWTAVGGATTSTAQKKFGSAALYLDGTNDYLEHSHADFAIGNATFVWDAWIYPTSLPNSSWLFGVGEFQYNRFGLYFPNSTTLSLVGSTSGTAWELMAGTTVALNTWQHVAFIKSGNTIYGALNGTIFGTTTLSGALLQSANKIIVGMHPAGIYYVQGYVDEMRLSVGTDRGWTANFTSPTSAYGGSTVQQYSYAI